MSMKTIKEKLSGICSGLLIVGLSVLLLVAQHRLIQANDEAKKDVALASDEAAVAEWAESSAAQAIGGEDEAITLAEQYGSAEESYEGGIEECSGAEDGAMAADPADVLRFRSPDLVDGFDIFDVKGRHYCYEFEDPPSYPEAKPLVIVNNPETTAYYK